MTGKADFTLGEWELVLAGPPTAGLIVVTAQRGGVFRETFAIGKAYAEARRLTMFLTNFTGISDREVPSTSMLREYIGRSSFRY